MKDIIIPAKLDISDNHIADEKKFETKQVEFGQDIPTTQSIPYYFLKPLDKEGLSDWYKGTSGLVEIKINSIFHKWAWIFDRKTYNNRPKFRRLIFNFPPKTFMECLEKSDLVHALAISEWGEAKAHEWLDEAYQPSTELLMEAIKSDLSINSNEHNSIIKKLLVDMFAHLWEKRDVKTIFFFDEIYVRNSWDMIANQIFRKVSRMGDKAYYSALAELLKGDFRKIYFNMRIRPLVENVQYGSIRDLCHRYLNFLPREIFLKKDELSFFFLSQSKNRLDRDVSQRIFEKNMNEEKNKSVNIELWKNMEFLLDNCEE